MVASVSTGRAVTRADQTSYVQALLRALARDEALGCRPPRLTEAGLATWQRFRGRLGSAELVQLLAEDGAVVYPLPFDPARVRAPFDLAQLDDDVVDDLLRALPMLPLTQPAAEYIDDQAKRLGVTPRLARSELHQVKAHQKVLELPGTGGLLAHHLVTTQEGLSLHQNCTIACDGWRELTLAGVIALDREAPRTDFIVAASAADLTDPAHPLRQASFDVVVGRRPDKGGQLHAADQLALWFHGAKIVLV
jgi:hypothetical protein